MWECVVGVVGGRALFCCAPGDLDPGQLLQIRNDIWLPLSPAIFMPLLNHSIPHFQWQHTAAASLEENRSTITRKRKQNILLQKKFCVLFKIHQKFLLNRRRANMRSQY